MNDCFACVFVSVSDRKREKNHQLCSGGSALIFTLYVGASESSKDRLGLCRPCFLTLDGDLREERVALCIYFLLCGALFAISC